MPKNLHKALEPFLIIVGSLSVSMMLFGGFVAAAGANPIEVYQTMYRAAFGSSFSWQNTLIRAAPLMLTALCTALPGYLGLIIIGGEGAVVMGVVGSLSRTGDVSCSSDSGSHHHGARRHGRRRDLARHWRRIAALSRRQ